MHGLARHPPTGVPGLQPVEADLAQPEALAAALTDIKPTHVFITTWLRRPPRPRIARSTAAMVRNLLAAVDGRRASGTSPS